MLYLDNLTNHTFLWKKWGTREHILYCSIYMNFKNRKNLIYGKRILNKNCLWEWCSGVTARGYKETFWCWVWKTLKLFLVLRRCINRAFSTFVPFPSMANNNWLFQNTKLLLPTLRNEVVRGEVNQNAMTNQIEVTSGTQTFSILLQSNFFFTF